MGKVVNIFEAKEKKENGELGENNTSVNDLFSDIIERNLSNSERMKKERLKKNKSVLRSYRIKKKK